MEYLAETKHLRTSRFPTVSASFVQTNVYVYRSLFEDVFKDIFVAVIIEVFLSF